MPGPDTPSLLSPVYDTRRIGRMFVVTPEAAREIVAHDYLHIFAASILFYDHLITLDREIEFIWRRPKSTSSYCFFSNRYGAFSSNVTVMVLGFTALPPQSCRRYNIVRQILLIINQLIICFLLSLRVYAVHGRSRRIRQLLSCVASILFAVAIWLLFGQKSTPAYGTSGCHINVSHKTAIRMSGAWWTLFVYDTLLFTLTTSKTWTTRKPRSQFSFATLTRPLTGSIYFAVIALSNLVNIMTYYFCETFMRGGLSTFAASISSTMMSRLMLNLHEVTCIGIRTTVEVTHIELDTLWSGALDQSVAASATSHSFGRNINDEARET